MRGRGHHLKLLTRDEVRRIAANIAQLPDLLRPPLRPDVDTVNRRSVIIQKLLLNMINAGSRLCD
jgi:hypothetical protein